MTTKKPTNKAKNIAAAAERLAKLQDLQQTANRLKAEFGFMGTPKQIVAQYEAHLANLAKGPSNNEMEQYVVDALNGPSRHALKNWLQSRVATYERVKRFFDERPAQHRVLQVVKVAKAA